MTTLIPMQIVIEDHVLDDLRARLDSYRRPPGLGNSGWLMGIDLDWLDRTISYWRDGFDWNAAAARLNRLSHFNVPIETQAKDTLNIHVVVEHGSAEERPPVLLIPGWPSSFLEFEQVVDRIAHPENHGGNESDGRTVVIADLPGFGLSSAPSTPMTHREMALVWRELMVDRLGYERFFVHGGDWGAVVGSWLALDYPEHVAGLHLSMMGFRPALSKDEQLSDAEKAWLGATKKKLEADSGYREVQATKPNTLAVGLSDSPAALAAWIVEKYHGWCGGAIDGPPPIDRDLLLTSATLYWATNHLPTANWIYWADRHSTDITLAIGQRVEVPTSLGLFDGGFFPPPPSEWAERAYNLVAHKVHPSGGHFPAWVEPEAFATSLQDFCKQLG